MSKKRRISWEEAKKIEDSKRKNRLAAKEAKRSQKRDKINKELYTVEELESQMKADYFTAIRKDA